MLGCKGSNKVAKQEDFAPEQAQGFKASEVHLTQTKEVK